MSSDPSILLRLLEPAVRPDRGAVAGAPVKPGPGGLPFEQTAFEELLKSARQPANPAQSAEGAASLNAAENTATKVFADPLEQLAEFNRIDNVNLRDALAGHHQPEPSDEASDPTTADA